jgi:DNA-binding MarR family transcriptional regulator
MTQIVDDLERLGDVTRGPDPADRRAKRVVYTERGRAAFTARRRVVERIKREDGERLGPPEYERLKQTLRELALTGPNLGGLHA